MLNSFNVVVKQYETESVDRINDLQTVQKFILIIIVAMLIFLGVSVFRLIWVKSENYTRHLESEANNDYLSGILNRRSFGVLAKTAIALSRR
ncbi:MAG: NADH:ubiquinone oxidoreductase subunit 4 (subunit M) [Alphaproteobacteria bacterium]|jgi:NADH:ubiquinone oxidoreductase subunit 4 (subunit M)